MKRLKLIWMAPVLAALVITSCGGEETNTEEPTNKTNTTPEANNEEDVTLPYFDIDLSTAQINWTAFKLESKAGVNGKFEDFELTGYEVGAPSVADFFANAKLNISTNSVSTGDTTRDYKIETFFFGTMMNTENIEITFKEIIGTTSGTAIADITMNGQTIAHDFSWQLSETFEFIITGTINVPDWGAQPSLDELNVVCEEKHKGQGDKSVLWPDVEISAYVTLTVEE